MTIAHLGQQVKRLHPDAYGHVPDHVLGRALQAKHPGLYDHFTDAKPRNLDSGTIPEAPKTLLLQLDQLSQGIRRVVFIARGSKVHPKAADFGAKKLILPSGEYYYKPDMIRPQEIIKAVANHELNEILGSASAGYGAPAKEDLQGEPQAVMSKDSAGETVQGVLTDPAHQQKAIEAAGDITPPGGKVSVEPPENEIANRIAAAGKFKGRVNGKWPNPRTPGRSI